MNKYAKESLKKVKKAKLPQYNDSTTHMIIPKLNNNLTNSTLVTIGKCYILKLEKYIINPPPNFNLHDNWNKGIPPKHEYVKAEIQQIMGKMIKINSVGYDYTNNKDTNDVWCGWVPNKSIRIVGEL